MDMKEFQRHMSDEDGMDYGEFSPRMKSTSQRKSKAMAWLLDAQPQTSVPVRVPFEGWEVALSVARTQVNKASRDLGWVDGENADLFATVGRGDELWFCRLLPGDARARQRRAKGD